MYIDTDTLESLLNVLDYDGVKELLDAYVVSTKEVISSLKKAEDDVENMRFFGHRLKGSSGTLGLTRMQSLGKAIETFAKVKDVESAKSEIDDVEKEFSITIEKMKEGYPNLF